MTDATASFYDVTSYGGRRVSRGEARRPFRTAAVSLGTIAAAGALATAVTLSAAWVGHTAFSSNPRISALVSTGPRALALADPDTTGSVNPTAHADKSFEDRWASAYVPASRSAMAMPLLPQPRIVYAQNIPMPPARPNVEQLIAQAAIPPVENVPLPQANPEPQVVARTQAAKPVLQIAAAEISSPPVPPRVPPKAPERVASLPATDKRTAVYDISAHTVYLPDGERLEAHSGLGDKMDDPSFIKVRMRGPTPPNVYDLTLREEIFHGVRAIRLNPVDDDKMYGRAGMLAHTYMLGENGQSNGCVSFKDYQKFLRAFLDGKVERLVVVAKLDSSSPLVARNRRTRDVADRYAFNSW
jgi:hypothetical protein